MSRRWRVLWKCVRVCAVHVSVWEREVPRDAPVCLRVMCLCMWMHVTCTREVAHECYICA